MLTHSAFLVILILSGGEYALAPHDCVGGGEPLPAAPGDVAGR